MVDDITASLETVQLSNQDSATDTNDDNTSAAQTALQARHPRKHVEKSKEQVIKEIEDEFFTPSHRFSTEWLDKLQRRWDDPPDYFSLFGLAPTMSRTIIRFNREGLEGRVTGYKEVTVPANSNTAKNSTSLLRKPASRVDFVRGKAGFFPFSPGGLEAGKLSERPEGLDETADDGETVAVDRMGANGLLQVAPGLTRGLILDKIDPDSEEQLPEDDTFKFGDIQPKRRKANGHTGLSNGDEKDAKMSEIEGIDDLLPIEFPLLVGGQLAPSSVKPRGKEWAHMVDINQELTNFRELVPNMAREWPFELDTFQKEAVYHLEHGDSVFVAAHTSAGKTVVAEYAIALAAKHMTKAIYTSPIKALSNQKFRDFRQEFDDVGILTGDVQINAEASCLIMTTEILRSMLYRGADLIRDVEFVIFDEVHYVNDQERGVVWEEVIIMLPDHVNLILLSATVPNTYEFASWVGRTKKKDIYVISTPKRPVPLEHYIWAGKKAHKIVDANKKFLVGGWKDANDALGGKKAEKPKIESGGQSSQGGRGGANPRGAPRGGAPRGGSNQRGRGAPQMRAMNNYNRGGGSARNQTNRDQNVWVHFVQHLKKEELLPACVFVFSKKRCEQNVESLSNLDFCTASEKSAIHIIVERSIARLRVEDRNLPQIKRMREWLSKGFAVHHGGLLPIVKEIVEILFAKSLVRVLFATETFAMGLNLPTRTVVFSELKKHDGRSRRDLLTGEYIQMAGRAGRRGLDAFGTVIIMGQGEEAPQTGLLNTMILGHPTKLQSQFRLTYNMILNLLRVEALKIEEMIKRSFSENATQTLLPEHERKVLANEADLKKLTREDCQYCNVDLGLLHKTAMNIKNMTQEIHFKAHVLPQGKRQFVPGRVVVIKEEDGSRTIGVLLIDGIASGSRPILQVLKLSLGKDRGTPSDVLPFHPYFSKFLTPLPKDKVRLREGFVPLFAIEYMSKTLAKFDIAQARRGDRKIVKEAETELIKYGQKWNGSLWEETDWNKVRELQFQELLEARKKEVAILKTCKCIACPDFAKHFFMRHKEFELEEEISQLKSIISDQNLQLLPDYEQRIQVLHELNFIDENSRVQLKGRVACEINSANELVLTELILENMFADYEPEEIVALLSCFVFQEKTDSIPVVPPKLEKGKQKILDIAKRVNEVQEHHQVVLNPETDDFETRPRFGLMEVVYEWARGMMFERITELTDVQEGTIVRVITRLDETCREVKNAARLVGDPSLFTKAEKCQEIIRRDIISCGSLYY